MLILTLVLMVRRRERRSDAAARVASEERGNATSRPYAPGHVTVAVFRCWTDLGRLEGAAVRMREARMTCKCMVGGEADNNQAFGLSQGLNFETMRRTTHWQRPPQRPWQYDGATQAQGVRCM